MANFIGLAKWQGTRQGKCKLSRHRTVQTSTVRHEAGKSSAVECVVHSDDSPKVAVHAMANTPNPDRRREIQQHDTAFEVATHGYRQLGSVGQTVEFVRNQGNPRLIRSNA